MINPVPRGSKVGIVSPSSALDSPEDIRDGLRWLESCGYRVVLGTHVYDRLNHMAGTPEQQAEDLMRFFADPEIKAVLPLPAVSAHSICCRCSIMTLSERIPNR